MNNTVTIMIPAYNAEMYIGRCIESLLSQTYKDIEILIVNDGSKDKTLEICEEFASHDDRVKVITQPNGGEGAARNTGVNNATGKYLCFVDADDYVKPEFIEHMMSLKKSNNAGMVICGYEELKESEILSVTSGDICVMSRAEALETLLKPDGFRGYVWNKMFDLDIIREHGYTFDTSLKIWTDVFFTFNYLMNVDTVVYDPTPMYYYIYVETSASHAANHVLGVEKSYCAIKAKNQMIGMIPDDYTGVKAQLAARYVQSSLAVIRNIGYCGINDENKKYLDECAGYIKKYYGEATGRISGKDKLFAGICMISPKLLISLYKLKR